MAIKLEPNPTFRATVTIQPPGDGKPFDIDCEFRHKTTEQRDEFAKSTKNDLDAVREILVGWKDDAVPYSDDVLATLIGNYPSAAVAFVGTYLRELMGARRGN
ncbi:phage tail assembly chaperone [Castellaniella ginsengisoli]|uniref:Phage tail assembly chaperone n=1 Tax=Castellaniella ginsengisoli TaxID=546114 RepID=A0AB39D335_9BURK